MSFSKRNKGLGINNNANENHSTNKLLDWDELARRANYRVAQLARLAGMSVQQLRRFIKKHTGLTPKRWMNEARFRRAARRLEQGQLVKEFLSDEGFSHLSNFSAAFSAFHGVPPSALRNFNLTPPPIDFRN